LSFMGLRLSVVISFVVFLVMDVFDFLRILMIGFWLRVLFFFI